MKKVFSYYNLNFSVNVQLHCLKFIIALCHRRLKSIHRKVNKFEFCNIVLIWSTVSVFRCFGSGAQFICLYKNQISHIGRGQKHVKLVISGWLPYGRMYNGALITLYLNPSTQKNDYMIRLRMIEKMK